MPSWNVHIAHVEYVLAHHALREIAVHNPSAFLLGNLLPDLYVGYMVPDISKKISYNTTHLADPSQVPLPDYDAFAARYLTQPPCTYDEQEHCDVLLGAWCHMMCDHCYNKQTRAFLAAHGIPRGEKARIGKQTDLATFGKTIDIASHITIDDDVMQQIARFPQYRIERCDVDACARVVDEIVAQNRAEHIYTQPTYIMLHQRFFDDTFTMVNNLLHAQLTAYARQHLVERD